MLKNGDLIAGRYRKTGLLGTGGMAEVHEASDIIRKEFVAIKIIKDELLNNKIQLDRFNNEAKLGAVVRHPNIVGVIDCGEYEGRPFLVYERIEGRTLSVMLSTRVQLPLREALRIMLQVCDGVIHIHKQKIIHRDIKPDNIFVCKDGMVKISDFGISYDLTEKHEPTKEVVGSVYYMAPELCLGKSPTYQSDIYALGITLFELLAGETPFNEGNPADIAKAHLKKSIPTLHNYNPELNKNVDYVIAKACAKKVEDRYQTCQEFKDDIQALLDNKDNFEQKRNIFKRIFGLK